MTPRVSLRSIGDLEAERKIVAIQDGNHGEKHPKSADYVAAGVPFVMANDIRDARLNLTDCKFLSQGQADSLRIGFARPGDVLLTHKGTIGRTCVVPNVEGYVMLTPQVTYYRVDPHQMCNKYLMYAFAEPGFQDRMVAVSAQSTRPYVGITAQRQLQVLAHPFPQQQKIASILSAYDDLIENNLRRTQILEEMAQALYREWFVEFRFPGHDNVEWAETEGRKLPEGWTRQPLGDVSVNFDRLRKPLSKMERAKRKGPYPYYGAAKVFDYIDDYIFDGDYLLFAEDGSVMTKDRHPVLQWASGRFWANNHTHILQGGDSVSTELLYLTLSMVDVVGYVTGAAQPKITQANLNRIPVVVASSQIAARFDALVKPMIALVQSLKREGDTLAATRDLLLPKLVSGELDTSELDIDVGEAA